jgi:hypothetical protein
MFSRDQLKRVASLTEEDFVRLLGRFPQQQPFELFEELACFSAAQLGLDAGLIEPYRKQQPTISEHQQTISQTAIDLTHHRQRRRTCSGLAIQPKTKLSD